MAENLLDALLDSWDRNNRILVGLLRAIPQGGLEVRMDANGHAVAELFTHLHSVRLHFVAENAPECARTLPTREWEAERDPGRIAEALEESAVAVREAVRGRVETGRAMERLYDHPILMIQHLTWYEGYHHGQIKLALKLAGQPIADDAAGPLTWSIWFKKTAKA